MNNTLSVFFINVSVIKLQLLFYLNIHIHVDYIKSWLILVQRFSSNTFSSKKEINKVLTNLVLKKKAKKKDCI